MVLCIGIDRTIEGNKSLERDQGIYENFVHDTKVPLQISGEEMGSIGNN